MPDRYLEMRSLLPLSYVNYIEKYNGWEGDLGEEFGYIILWDKEMIQERWEAYEVARYLSDRWFPFGSDGGGEMLCFDLESGGDSVFWISYVGMADEEAMLGYDSFKDIVPKITVNH